MPLLLSLYQLFTKIFGPLIYNTIHYYRLKNGKENSARIKERKGYASLPRPIGNVIWFHAASNGEVLTALSVIKAVRAQYNQLNFVITSGTLTSAALLQNNLPTFVQHQFIPADVPQWIDRFLAHWQPQLLIIIESEIWPNLIMQTVQRSVSILLLNGRVSEKTFKKWQQLTSVSNFLISKFDLILAQSNIDQQRFKTLGNTNVDVIKNIKFASQPLTYSFEELTNLQQQIVDRPLWIAASTHSPEEQDVITAHNKIKIDYPNLLTIIIPRHPIRADKICDQFDDAELCYARRSKQQPITEETEIYLVDTVGELGLFYRLGHIVFLGGSLANIGGHNIIEPALLNNAVIYGPYMHKQIELTQIFESKNAVSKINDVDKLAETVIDLLNDFKKCQQFQDNARAVALDQHKVLDVLSAKLKPYITVLIP